MCFFKKNIFKDGNILSSWRKAYQRFLKIRGTPKEIALGLALGLFIGMSPSMGFQMIIAVFFASIFQWNKISAMVGVWISNPITAPFLYGFTFIVGEKLTGITGSLGHFNSFNLDLLLELAMKSPRIFITLTIGGIITGIPIAVIGYFFSFSAVKKYQDDIKNKIVRQKERLKIRAKKKRRTK